MFGLPISEPEIGLAKGTGSWNFVRFMRKNKIRAFYSRQFSNNHAEIVLHFRPQPNTRSMRGVRDVVGVLTHETLHWVLDRFEQPASRMLDNLPESIWEVC